MFVICYAESVHCTMTELRVRNILKQDGDNYFIPMEVAQALVLISWGLAWVWYHPGGILIQHGAWKDDSWLTI